MCFYFFAAQSPTNPYYCNATINAFSHLCFRSKIEPHWSEMKTQNFGNELRQNCEQMAHCAKTQRPNAFSMKLVFKKLFDAVALRSFTFPELVFMLEPTSLLQEEEIAIITVIYSEKSKSKESISDPAGILMEYTIY